MSNMNQVILQGNLVDNPQVMGDENKVVRFTMAVNNGFGDRRTTTFVDCVGFGKQVDTISNHVTKGKQILVRGQLHQNRWEDKETGKNRSKLEVRLENVNGFFFTGNANASETAAAATTTEDSDGGNLF